MIRGVSCSEALLRQTIRTLYDLLCLQNGVTRTSGLALDNRSEYANQPLGIDLGSA
jgi:hypothetical protein